MSKTYHHRNQRANQCKDLWGRRGDMGSNSHYSSYNRTAASRKERYRAKNILAGTIVTGIKSIITEV